AAAVGERPGDLKAVAVAVAMVGGEGYPGGQIDVDGNRGHGLPGPARGVSGAGPSRERDPPPQASRCETPRKVPGSHLSPEEPSFDRHPTTDRPCRWQSKQGMAKRSG